MPLPQLPQEAATLTGGCSCGAIRYRIAVPPADQRTASPFAPPDLGHVLPTTILCHCNDCRRHTGSILPPAFFQTAGHTVTVSVLEAPASGGENVVTGRFLDVLSEDYDQAAADTTRPPYKPATEVFCAEKAKTSSPSYLRFFHSTDSGANLSRLFCNNCGSPVSYHIKLQADWCPGQKLPDEYEDLFDIAAGTLDRKWIEEGWVQVEDEVNWKHGVEIGRRVTATAKGLEGLTKWIGLGPMEGSAGEEELEGLRK